MTMPPKVLTNIFNAPCISKYTVYKSVDLPHMFWVTCSIVPLALSVIFFKKMFNLILNILNCYYESDTSMIFQFQEDDRGYEHVPQPTPSAFLSLPVFLTSDKTVISRGGWYLKYDHPLLYSFLPPVDCFNNFKYGITEVRNQNSRRLSSQLQAYT